MNNHDIMIVIGRSVNSAIDQAFEIFKGSRLDFTIWLEELITTTQIRHITTDDGLTNVRAMLSNESTRDFLLTLDMLVHSRIADQYLLYKGLITTLTNSLSIDGFSTDAVQNDRSVNLFQAEYIERVPSKEVTSKLLMNNKILVSILAICLFGRPRFYVEKVGDKFALRERIAVAEKA